MPPAGERSTSEFDQVNRAMEIADARMDLVRQSAQAEKSA